MVFTRSSNDKRFSHFKKSVLVRSSNGLGLGAGGAGGR